MESNLQAFHYVGALPNYLNFPSSSKSVPSLKRDLKSSFPSYWHVYSHFKQQRLKIWPSIDLAAPFKTDWAQPPCRAAKLGTHQLAQQLSAQGEHCNRGRFTKLYSQHLIWLWCWGAAGDRNACQGSLGITGAGKGVGRWLGGGGWYRLLPGDGPSATSQRGPTGAALGMNVSPVRLQHCARCSLAPCAPFQCPCHPPGPPPLSTYFPHSHP